MKTTVAIEGGKIHLADVYFLSLGSLVMDFYVSGQSWLTGTRLTTVCEGNVVKLDKLVITVESGVWRFMRVTRPALHKKKPMHSEYANCGLFSLMSCPFLWQPLVVCLWKCELLENLYLFLIDRSPLYSVESDNFSIWITQHWINCESLKQSRKQRFRVFHCDITATRVAVN